MKYYLDTEFIEGFHKPLFGKKRHFIDLISIGIVCEDGREYYAISNEFNGKDANKWVKDNVLSKLPLNNFNGSNASTAKLFKSNRQIAHDIIEFCMPYAICKNGEQCCKMYDPHPDDLKENLTGSHELFMKVNSPEFYAYYADYDWVVFCSLFGTMMDLPKCFPMYCKDLKQMIDEKSSLLKYEQTDGMKGLDYLKTLESYPTQEKEHSVLDDAKWNHKLYNFLQTI